MDFLRKSFVSNPMQISTSSGNDLFPNGNPGILTESLKFLRKSWSSYGNHTVLKEIVYSYRKTCISEGDHQFLKEIMYLLMKSYI